MDKLKIRFNFVHIDFDKAITWFICLYFSNGLVRLAARRVLAVARLQSSYILFANLIIYMPLILVLVLMISKRKIDKSLWSFLLVLCATVFFFASFSGRHMVHGRMCSGRTAELFLAFWL